MEKRNDSSGITYRSVHPGELVKDWLDDSGISQKRFAETIGIPASRLNEFIKGKRDMTANMAQLLANHLGMTADYWMRAQAQYEYNERMLSLRRGGRNTKTHFSLMSSVAVDHIKGYDFNMNIYVYTENGEYLAYCPSLDISTSGTSENDAISNLYKAFQLYVEECIENDNLEESLEAHGWKCQSKEVHPPTDDVIKNKTRLKGLLKSSVPFKRINIPMNISF